MQYKLGFNKYNVTYSENSMCAARSSLRARRYDVFVVPIPDAASRQPGFNISRTTYSETACVLGV